MRLDASGVYAADEVRPRIVEEDVAPLPASDPLTVVIERGVALGQLLVRQAPERIVSEASTLLALIDLDEAVDRVIAKSGLHRPARERSIAAGIRFRHLDQSSERVRSRPPLAPPWIGHLNRLPGLA